MLYFRLILQSSNPDNSIEHTTLCFTWNDFHREYKMPFNIPPLFRKVDLINKYSYDKYSTRRYGFTKFEDTFHIAYGADSNSSIESKVKVFDIPWMQWKFKRRSYLYQTSYNRAVGEGARGEVIYNTILEYGRLDEAPGYLYKLRRKSADKYTFSDHEIVSNLPTTDFEFLDYDAEVITAKCRIEEIEWTKGITWCFWLKYFVPNLVRTSVNLEFSKEVGKGKGSWKGGTLGTSIDLLNYEEPIEDAFKRYCEKHKLTFVSKIKK